MVTYRHVALFNDCIIGGNTYYEDSLHKPRLPSPADANGTPPGMGDAAYNYYTVTPRKGHELDELELPIYFNEVFNVLKPGAKAKVICI